MLLIGPKDWPLRGASMPSDQRTVQRFLTIEFITKRKLRVQTIWLRPEAAAPSPEDAVKPTENLACDPHDWIDERNLGARLADGFIEVKIQSPDDIWAQCLFKAFRCLGVDARAAYGSQGRPISSVLLRIADPQSIDRWENLWPHGHRDKAGQWVETKFAYSLAPTPRAKPVWRNSAPLPGSYFNGALVEWRPFGKPAADLEELGLEDLEPREIAPTQMELICRAIAFATLGYYIGVYLDGLTQWDESLTRTVGGWIARLVPEGMAINAQGQSLEGVCWAPIDSEATARQLLAYLGNYGAPRELDVAYSHAQARLEHNPQALIPGWKTIETCFGPHARAGLRSAFKAGLNIDVLEQMSEQYFFDRSLHRYIDRQMMLDENIFEFNTANLIERHEPDPKLWITPRKRVNPFRLYSTSSLRSDVNRQVFLPGEMPGGVVRFSRVHELIKSENRQADEYLAFNTFPGFAIKPVSTINPTVMQSAVSLLDRALGLVTKNNDERMLWLKKFIAHMVQYPGEKPQVCPILVGGQGIGKSMFGSELMRALIGRMAGNANAGDFSNNRFIIEPFIRKLIVFIDEVRLESIEAINNIKKIIRSSQLSGQEKFEHQRDYYIPARLLVATNSADIGLTPADAGDRTFFFIMSSTAENMRMSEREFIGWANGFKPFYNDFATALKSLEVRQHLMRYFMEIEVERAELEDLTHSSSGDENVVMATMSPARRVARQIVADAHVIWAFDITAWFNDIQLREAIKRVDGPRSRVEASEVRLEFERADVITKQRGYYRFKWGYGKLLKELGRAHALPIEQVWDFQPGDFDDNSVMSPHIAPPWRGLKQGQPREEPRYNRDRDPDYMEPE
jgi:hypothetical protein